MFLSFFSRKRHAPGSVFPVAERVAVFFSIIRVCLDHPVAHSQVGQHNPDHQQRYGKIPTSMLTNNAAK
jgi:hypothetical protein